MSKVIKALNDWRDRKERESWLFGKLGKLNPSGSYTFDVPGRKNYVYVTMRQSNGAQTVISARNDAGVPHAPRLNVKMKLEFGDYVIYGKTARADLGSNPPSEPTGVEVHDHDSSYFTKIEFVDTSSGAGSAGLPVKLNSDGFIDPTMVDVSGITAIIEGEFLDSTTIDFTIVPGVSITAIVIDDSISNAKLRNSGALSVIGRSANTTGDPADISAVAASGAVLRESGSALGFGTVATAGIADAAVTLAKMANIATDSLIGRDTAASGVPEVITLGASLSMTGAQVLQRAALTGDVTAAVNSNATTIANDAVTTVKILNSNVTYAKIQNVSATDKVLGRSTAGAGVVEEIAFTAAARALADDADAAAMRTTLGLVAAGAGDIWVEKAGDTMSGQLKLDSTLLLSSGSQDYLVTDRGNNIAFQAQTSGTLSSIELYAKDGDGTDSVHVSIWNVGTPASVTNSERVIIGYDAAGLYGYVKTLKSGTGTARPLQIFTESDTDQLYLSIDGKVGIQQASPAGQLEVVGTATTGETVRITRNLTATSTDSPVVFILQDHASDDQPALKVEQDGTGDIFQLYDAAVEVMYVEDGGIFNFLAKHVNSSQETIARFGLDEASSARLIIFNGTVTDGAFAPAFGGVVANAARPSVGVTGFVVTGQDSGTQAAIKFDAAVTDDGTNPQQGTLSALGTKPIFAVSNNSTVVLLIGPDGQVTVTQQTVGSLVLRLSSIATNDDPTEDYYQGRVTTTNNTATTALTIPISASNTYLIELNVVARRTGGSAGAADDGYGQQLIKAFKTASGTVTLLGTLQDISSSLIFPGGLLTISGTNVLVQVQGVTNNNIVWHVFVKVRKVGT